MDGRGPSHDVASTPPRIDGSCEIAPMSAAEISHHRSPTPQCARSSRHLSCEVDGEVVLMSIEDGTYFSLNPTASEIWNCLESPKTSNEIVQALQAAFEVSQSNCVRAVESFLTELESGCFISRTKPEAAQ